LVAAAYVRYCRYIDPQTGQLTDVMTVARELARAKAQGQSNAGKPQHWPTLTNYLRLMLGVERAGAGPC
jgi:capsule polysaccharide export protein KpsC/LpsZ